MEHASSLNIKVNPKIFDILPEYLEWLKLHRAKKTYQDVCASLKTLVPHFGHLQVTSITRKVITKYQDKRKTTPRACNKEIDYFMGIIGYMVDNDFCYPLPFKIQKLKYKTPLPEVPHPGNIDRFINEITAADKKCMVLLMYLCGFRWNEVSHMTWEGVSFIKGNFRARPGNQNTQRRKF